jgi:hypothetical protein
MDGERMRPIFWCTAMPDESDDLALGILIVGTPNPGIDLAIVTQMWLANRDGSLRRAGVCQLPSSG